VGIRDRPSMSCPDPLAKVLRVLHPFRHSGLSLLMWTGPRLSCSGRAAP
jgi:hypothetical protein